MEKSRTELLSPECINVLAEKLTSESNYSFCDFFNADFDSPPNIKKSVATVLASNPELRSKLAAKIAKCDYRDMSSWLCGVITFFDQEIVREIFIDVEHALLAVAGDPGFKGRFEIYSPERLIELREYFVIYGLVSAARVFDRIIQEGREESAKIDRILNGDQHTDKTQIYRTNPHRKQPDFFSAQLRTSRVPRTTPHKNFNSKKPADAQKDLIIHSD